MPSLFTAGISDDDAQARATSSITIAVASASAPAPPYSAGMCGAWKSRGAQRVVGGLRELAGSSAAAAFGATLPSHTARTAARIASCSSGSSVHVEAHRRPLPSLLLNGSPHAGVHPQRGPLTVGRTRLSSPGTPRAGVRSLPGDPILAGHVRSDRPPERRSPGRCADERRRRVSFPDSPTQAYPPPQAQPADPGRRCPSGAQRPRLTFLGTGYLGATYAICFAELGYEVLGFDVDAAKIAKLAAGEVPFHEPGLDELLRTQPRRRPAALHHRLSPRRPSSATSTSSASARRSATTAWAPTCATSRPRSPRSRRT